MEEMVSEYTVGPQEIEGPSIFTYLVSSLFYLVFFSVLLSFEILLRLGALCGKSTFSIAEAGLNRWVCRSLRVLGTKIRVYGNLPDIDAPIIIISNHQSMFDISILFTVFRRYEPRFVAKIELARGIPSVSYNLRKRAGVLIDRSNPRQAIPVLNEFAKNAVNSKSSIVIFPEGTRSRDGRLGKFKASGFASIYKHMDAVPVVPVAIDGSWKITARRYGPAPVGVVISVRICSPIYPGSERDSLGAVVDVHRSVEEDSVDAEADRIDGVNKPLSDVITAKLSTDEVLNRAEHSISRAINEFRSWGITSHPEVPRLIK